MAFSFTPTPPPDTGDYDDLVRWAYENFEDLSNNLLQQRQGWNDLKIPVTSTKTGGAKDPGFIKVTDNGSGSQGVYTWAFDGNIEEELFFVVQLPHARVRHSDLRPHLHWMPSDSNAGVVRWGLEYTIANAFEVFGNTTILYADEDTTATQHKHLITGFDPDIDGTQVRDSSMILCRIFRDAGHANDTYSSDALLLEVDFHILLEALGSDEEYPSS